MQINSFEDLSEFDFGEEIDEESSKEINKAKYSNYSKDVAITIGYLLGVKLEFLQTLDDVEKVDELYNKLETDENAKSIRVLNNIRSNIMLLFKKVSRTIRVTSSQYKPIYKIEEFEEDFKTLTKLGIDIITGRSDLNEYLMKINDEIQKRIDNVKHFFPSWINYKNIKNMFNMPSNIKAESETFQNNQNYYPYKRYFNWRHPDEKGNLLSSDVKILTEIYESNHEYFQEISRVIDASDNVKNNINEFINRGRKIQIFVDGENCDPYSLAAMFDSLKDYEIQKIDKVIVYYDEIYSSKAWNTLHLFTYGVEVEAIAVGRIYESKSLVDHKIVGGVSKAVYRDNVDSIILASSDSDFWSVMEAADANYLVLVESDKCGYEFKSILREHDIFYCYLDKFKVPEEDEYFNIVFKNELKKIIEEKFSLGNAKEILNEALGKTHVTLTKSKIDNLYNSVMKNLKLKIDKDGNYEISLD